ncbi:MAG: hypothetical protein ACI4GV_04120 [Acutalibacteraceae bacterium]
MSGLSFGLITLVYGIAAVAAASSKSASKKASSSVRKTSNRYEQTNRQQRQPIQYYNGYYNNGTTNAYRGQNVQQNRQQNTQQSRTQNVRQNTQQSRQQNVQQTTRQNKQSYNTNSRQANIQAQEQRQLEKYSNNLGNLRNDIQSNMNRQVELNRQASEKMIDEIEQVRAEMQAASEKSLEDYDEYLGLMKEKRQELSEKIYSQQEAVNRQYRDKISESMVQITTELNNKHKEYLDELSQLQNDIQAKNEKAAEIAKSYIAEAQTTIKSLIEDFEGEKYVGRELIALNEQLNKAIDQYNKGYYESAIAASKDALIGTVEEIYHADEKKQEWENYYKIALALSSDLKTFIDSQEIISQDLIDSVKAEKNIELNEEIVGTKIADYTGKNSKGVTKYDYIRQKSHEIDEMLNSDDAKNLSSEQLRQYIDFINTQLYPQSACCITTGILNMDNAYSRQNMSEDIVDFFEEHNFSFAGYSYDENRHDKPLHVYLSNEATGEELVVSLAPQQLENGDIQTRVELEQVKGDETNEERKAYYRECINQVITQKNPGSSVNIQCDKSTVNKLSNGKQAQQRRQAQNNS